MSSHQHRSAGEQSDRNIRLLLLALLVVTAFLAGEVVVAVASSSLALLADAGHMLTDALAIGMAIAAARLARRPAAGVWTFGFGRAEVLSASINGVTLLVVAAVVLVESVRRLSHPPDVAGGPVTAVAIVGLAVNVVVTLILSRADRRSLNIAGVFAHALTDAYAFAATLAAGVLILTTGYRRADTIASLFVVLLMLRAAWTLLRRSGTVLLEMAPEGVDLVELRAHLLGTGQVLDVHDLHAWTVGTGLPAVSAHVVIVDDCFANGFAPQLLDELQGCLAGHFDVEHSTFQLEPAGHTEHESGTH
ncbi:MAG: cobalt-zinc-cadmium efflux system protein [Frankiaceae bacterium]|nr:cobalt-zinc-cadmium efflux system protein [Frankiaceae bacterium]